MKSDEYFAFALAFYEHMYFLGGIIYSVDKQVLVFYWAIDKCIAKFLFSCSHFVIEHSYVMSYLPWEIYSCTSRNRDSENLTSICTKFNVLPLSGLTSIFLREL